MNKTFAILLGIILYGSIPAAACWYPTYKPGEFLTCRLDTADKESYSGKDDMLDQWTNLLPGAGRDQVAKLIDNAYSIADVEALRMTPELNTCLSDNKSLHEYIVVMLKTQAERKKLTDPWHYYYSGDPKLAQLDSLADVSLARLSTTYGDRYAVQAARALLSLRRYSDIIAIADSHKFRDAEMRDLFNQYYAGALYKLGEFDKALQIYVDCGDDVSAEWCLKRLGRYASKMSLIADMADSDGNYEMVNSMLQSYITGLEIEASTTYYDSQLSPVEIGDLITTAHSRSVNPGRYRNMWRYAEAMGHLLNATDYARADSALALINLSELSPEMKRSVRALRFITQSQLRGYDKDYLRWVAREAQWLIDQGGIYSPVEVQKVNFMGDRYTATVLLDKDHPEKEISTDLSFNRNTHVSTLYFSDMLHRATDCIIVPKMLEAGDTVAALQLLDVVDYANLSDDAVKDFDDHGNASACFAMECGPDVVIKAMASNSTPISALWRKNGSIRNPSRWYDLAGTLLIRGQRYKEAVAMLGKVDSDYAEKRSSSAYDTKRNPFMPGTEQAKSMAEANYYKLGFAEQMAELEDRMASGGNPEDAVIYAVGMRNSVYPCWSLTQYGRGTSPFFPYEQPGKPNADVRTTEMAHDFIIEDYSYDCMQPNPFANSDKRLARLCDDSRRLFLNSLSKMTDREKAASILRDFGYYRTVKYDFGDTPTALALKSECDRWEDW